jgi:hypothetical protein
MVQLGGVIGRSWPSWQQDAVPGVSISGVQVRIQGLGVELHYKSIGLYQIGSTAALKYKKGRLKGGFFRGAHESYDLQEA